MTIAKEDMVSGYVPDEQAHSDLNAETVDGLLFPVPGDAQTVDVPFFLNSGFPFLTVAITISPTPAAGSLLSRAPMPLTEMMYRFRAPELSAQDMTAPLVDREWLEGRALRTTIIEPLATGD